MNAHKVILTIYRYIMSDIFILNDQYFDTFTEAYEAAKDGDVIFVTGDIFDVNGSLRGLKNLRPQGERMIYDVVFDGQKITIEADHITCIGTKVWFRMGEELVAYFDVPFGTSFGYAVRPTK